MHYAVEGHAIVELRALYLPMNTMSRIVEICCTVSDMRADCLYLARKMCISSHEHDIRCSASKFGTYLFNLDIAQAFRRIHIIRSGLKHFRLFSSNFDTEILQK